MAQYIDKAAVTAGIGRLKGNLANKHGSFEKGYRCGLDSFASFIDTLEAKEAKTGSDEKQLKLKEECRTCIYNLYGIYPCAAVNEQGSIDYLEGKSDGCSNWYDEW